MAKATKRTYTKTEILRELREILGGTWQIDTCDGEGYIHVNDDCLSKPEQKKIGKFLKSIANEVRPSDKGAFVVCK